MWRCISYKKVVVFHCYVSLPEGIPLDSHNFLFKPFFGGLLWKSVNFCPCVVFLLKFRKSPVEVPPKLKICKNCPLKNTSPPRREEFEPQLWWVLKTFPFPAGHCKRSLLITGPSAPRPPYPPTNESVSFVHVLFSLRNICGEFLEPK